MVRSGFVLILLTAISLMIPACSAGRQGLSGIMLVGSESGGLRVLVRRDESALLFYGALMGLDVREGTFDIDEIYNGLRGRLVYRHTYLEDASGLIYSEVLFDFEDGSREEFYMSDQAFVGQVLITACENLESEWHSAGDVYDRACEELTGQAP
jgi:hypothetical protein